jgi:hypothetical protein
MIIASPLLTPTWKKRKAPMPGHNPWIATSSTPHLGISSPKKLAGHSKNYIMRTNKIALQGQYMFVSPGKGAGIGIWSRSTSSEVKDAAEAGYGREVRRENLFDPNGLLEVVQGCLLV